jgi:hypothetical protein
MNIDYDIAGFPDEDGNLGRPVPAGQIIVPKEVWLEDDCIHWKLGNRQLRDVSRSMLNQFIRLSDADSVLRFAREWGVLALSKNLADDPGDRHYLPGRQMEDGVEPVSAWQYYSERAKAVLNVAAALKEGKLGDMSDWDKLATFFGGPIQDKRVMEWGEKRFREPHFGFGWMLYDGLGAPSERIEVARDAISNEIKAWLECWRKGRTDHPSDFALRWIDEKQRWDLQISYHGLLFPAIGLQLALVLADADSLYDCSGCGIPYVRPRERKRPKPGCDNYCDNCSKDGVAERRAAENYRHKRAEAVRLHSTGSSVSEIAEELKANPTKIRQWVEKGDGDGKKKTRK